MEHSGSKLACAINKQIAKFIGTIDDSSLIVLALKEELEDVKRIKSELISALGRESADDTQSPALYTHSDIKSLLTDVTLFEKIEEQRNAILFRTQERESKWKIEEERIQKEKLEYEALEREWNGEK